MNKGFGYEISRPSLLVVCVLVIHPLGSFFGLNCLSDVSNTQHYMPIGKLWTCTYVYIILLLMF